MLSPREKVIEDFGLYLESYGLPRIVGRVYGALLITDELALGLDSLTEELGISKASASTAARQLHGFHLIEKVSLPGDRRDYYCVSPDAHVQYLQMSMDSTLRFVKLLQAAAHIGDLSPPARAKLERIEHLYEALAEEIEKFFKTYRFDPPTRTQTRRTPKKGA
jgi:DNA-binding transcriptional regulator GbsR (MarR family)